MKRRRKLSGEGAFEIVDYNGLIDHLNASYYKALNEMDGIYADAGWDEDILIYPDGTWEACSLQPGTVFNIENFPGGVPDVFDCQELFGINYSGREHVDDYIRDRLRFL